jgi:mRNA-degrading endonuclease RelE of RelBE toxin-antitoxin system
MNLRVRPTLKAKLEKLAKQDRRTLSAYVEKLPGEIAYRHTAVV